MPLPAAVANRRFHHQLPQGKIMEGEPFSPIPPDLALQLQARGYTVSTNSFDTDIQAIKITGRDVMPVSDPRGRGLALIVTWCAGPVRGLRGPGTHRPGPRPG